MLRRPPNLFARGTDMQHNLAIAWRPIERKDCADRRRAMKKVWNKPQVTEEQVGLEVTSYLPAEMDAT